MKPSYYLPVVLWVILCLIITTGVSAAQSLGMADSFGILASTYTNTVGWTTINWYVGYTTPPALLPTINGNTHVADATYNQAGIDQNAALASLNGQACTFTFAPGPIDLATDITHGPIGVYTWGVYCIDGAASIGAAGITLSGNSTFIFRMTGALTTVVGSVVSVSNGASVCDVWRTPGGATTLAATSTFLGTTIDTAGITMGANTNRLWRALSFWGTITTDSNVITVPTCTAPPTLTIIKTVINDNWNTKTAAQFPLFIWTWQVTNAVPNILSPGEYVVSELNTWGYIASVWWWDCTASWSILLANGDNKTCTITNNDISQGWGNTLKKDVCPDGDFSPTEYDTVCEVSSTWAVALPVTGTWSVNLSSTWSNTSSIPTSIPTSNTWHTLIPFVFWNTNPWSPVTQTPSTLTPKFPNTWAVADTSYTILKILIVLSIFSSSLLMYHVITKK